MINAFMFCNKKNQNNSFVFINIINAVLIPGIMKWLTL